MTTNPNPAAVATLRKVVDAYPKALALREAVVDGDERAAFHALREAKSLGFVDEAWGEWKATGTREGLVDAAFKRALAVVALVAVDEATFASVRDRLAPVVIAAIEAAAEPR